MDLLRFFCDVVYCWVCVYYIFWWIVNVVMGFYFELLMNRKGRFFWKVLYIECVWFEENNWFRSKFNFKYYFLFFLDFKLVDMIKRMLKINDNYLYFYDRWRYKSFDDCKRKWNYLKKIKWRFIFRIILLWWKMKKNDEINNGCVI